MYLAAVLSNCHVSTGRHHGEAFANLSYVDQEAGLVSGHVNPDGTFTTEMDFLDKEIILIRHAESMWNANLTDNLDSTLTLKGVSQAQKLASFIRKSIDCRGLRGFVSPFDRCLLTSLPIRRQTGIKFAVNSEVREISFEFPESGVEIPDRKSCYFEIEWTNYLTSTFYRESNEIFLSRLRVFLDLLPNRSIIITHGSIIQTMIEMILGLNVTQVPKWDNSIENASITHIKNGTVILLAKKID